MYTLNHLFQTTGVELHVKSVPVVDTEDTVVGIAKKQFNPCFISIHMD